MQDYLTRHAASRMSQRAIRPGDLELIERLGTEVEGGHLVRLKDFQAFEREQKRLVDRVRRLVGKRVVRDGNTLVTAYHADRAKARQLLRQGCGRG
jgi:hypothetical protein